MTKQLVFPTRILEQHLVVLGKTGAGKSSALRHIVEHLLLHKKRVCIVDPKGDWNGLKVSADGRSAGFPVILFGDFKETAGKQIPADVPLNEYSGRHIAELVTSGNRPCVIGLRGWTQGNMHKFWVDFASTVFNSNTGELYLVIDEVHNFAPKGKILSPEVGIALHWSNRVMNEGRGIGLVNLIASQRPQKVHNDTLTACETLVAMRVIHKADRDAVEDWIKGCGDPKQGTEVLNALAGMKRGEAFVWSPEVEFGPERLAFPMFTTFDSFAPPQLQTKVSGKDWASVDLDEVKQKLASVIEKAKAEDPKELRKQIAELKKQLTAKTPAPVKPVETVKEVEKLVLKDAQIKRLESFGEKLATVGTELVKFGNDLIGELRKVSTNGHKPVAQRSSQIDRVLPERKPTPARQPREPKEIGDFRISSSQQKILNSLVWLEQGVGLTPVPKKQVALMAGQSPTSGGFFNNLGTLRSAGLIDYPNPGSVALTEAGLMAADDSAVPQSSEELQQQVMSMVSNSQATILKELISAYPDPLSKNDLAERVGQSRTSGGYFNNLGRLRSLGMIDYPQAGYAVAADVLFRAG